MGISTLTQASESTCEYNYSLLHVIFNKVVTYKLEACDHVRKCFTKIFRRKFIDNLKRATAQDQWRIISVMESFLMKLLGWTLDLQLQWKKASTCGYIKTFRASTDRSCICSTFLIKFRVVTTGQQLY